MKRANQNQSDSHSAGEVLLYLLQELTKKCPDRKFTARELSAEAEDVCIRTLGDDPLHKSLEFYDALTAMPRIVNRIE